MDVKQIKEIVNIVSDSDIDFFKVETKGIKLELAKVQKDICVQKENTNSKNHIKFTESEIPHDRKDKNIKKLDIVRAPLAGTFLEYEDPSTKEVVKVGDCIENGQPICTVEAMKMVNIVESECTGKIVEILAKPLDFVEYDQPLFAIEVKDQ